MIKLTTIVLCFEGAVHSVRVHNGWMGEREIDAYLDGVETVKPGTNIVFNRITMHSDIGETDGGWVSAHRAEGRWTLAAGT